jgi:hypothetical protein
VRGVALALAAACASGPILIAGCGATPPAARKPPSTDGGSAGSNNGDAKGAPNGLAPIDALAARGPTDAPLMREVLRVESAAPRSAEIRADRDLCVRAIFAASQPVRAWFADAAGAARGEVATGATGAVPPRGPVCARKGESLHLVVEGERAVAARAVLFAAP